MKITDKKMIKALNTLIDGCEERACEKCIFAEKCADLLDTYMDFSDMEKMDDNILS